MSLFSPEWWMFYYSEYVCQSYIAISLEASVFEDYRYLVNNGMS